MMRHTTLPLLAMLLLTSCMGLLRTPEQRKAHRAQRHLAKAVWLDPGILRTTTTTDTVVVPADSARLAMAWKPVVLDSLLHACSELLAQRDQLAEALTAERELYAHAMATRHTAPAPPARIIERIRDAACQWDAQVQYHGNFRIEIYPGSTGAPVVRVKQMERTILSERPCPPQVTLAPPKERPWMHEVGIAFVRVTFFLFFLFLIYLLLRWAWRKWRHLLPITPRHGRT